MGDVPLKGKAKIFKAIVEISETKAKIRRLEERITTLENYISDLEFDRETDGILDTFDPNQGPHG